MMSKKMRKYVFFFLKSFYQQLDFVFLYVNVFFNVLNVMLCSLALTLYFFICPNATPILSPFGFFLFLLGSNMKSFSSYSKQN